MVKMIECACGCSTLIEECDKQGRKRRYVHNHHGKGKKRSEKTRRKISESNKGVQAGENHPMFGKKASKTHCKNISEALKGRKLSEEHRKNLSESKKGENNVWFGKKFTEEHCKNISESNKGKHSGKKHSLKAKKKMSEARSGENHYNWQGGISFEPYCPKFNEAFKEKVREKYNRKCFLCGKTEEDNNNRKLSVHHVQYNKNCGCDDDLRCDFVPLCMSCHAKTTNSKHDYWGKKIALLINNLIRD